MHRPQHEGYMAKVLTLSELLALQQQLFRKAGLDTQRRVLLMMQEVAKELADLLDCDIDKPSWSGDADAQPMVGFYPKEEGDPCPYPLTLHDPDGSWEPKKETNGQTNGQTT